MTTTSPSLSLQDQIKALEELCSKIHLLKDIGKKLSLIESQPHVRQALLLLPQLKKNISQLPPSTQYVILSVFVIGQGPTVFQDFETMDNPLELLHHLIEKLSDLEKFYDSMDGLIGYHLLMLKLISTNEKEIFSSGLQHYEKPEGLDISTNTLMVRQSVRWGVESLKHLGAIYPLGGAGDRLDLRDEITGEPLPAAQLFFCGRSMLEGLVRDLQGWEFLYYKLFGKQLVTPIAIMTSHEKKNHQRVTELCEIYDWFGRTKESFHFFIQPLVPMVTTDGEWVMSGPLMPMLKPGGHGAIWKAAMDDGVFDWFEQLKRTKIFIRQINNPVAGMDNGLIALTGIGYHQNKHFGFASCHRLLRSPEGMNVLKETKRADGDYEYCITNIEYTEFSRHGIEDVSEEKGSIYSQYPSNTNILFCDLEAVKKALKVCPLPGILVNMKNQVDSWHSKKTVKKLAGRLESTMQNIADYITDKSPQKLTKVGCQDLHTFLIYNQRRKTISVIKKTYVQGEPLNGTPEGCFFEMMENYRDLLTCHCGMVLPPEQKESDFLSKGPNFMALFHPALGVLYTVISQKIRKGSMSIGSECIIEASEVDIANLELSGSLIIEADTVMGNKDIRNVIIYDNESCGKCTLNNVKVHNRGHGGSIGIDAWHHTKERNESLHIVLNGNGEFFAENVEFIGNVHFEVPNGHRLVVYQQGNETAWYYEKIAHATWRWDYTFDENDHICLEKVHISR